jgi:hypothetical protein
MQDVDPSQKMMVSMKVNMFVGNMKRIVRMRTIEAQRKKNQGI